MVFGEFLAKSQKPLVNFFKPVINFFLTSDLFSLTTGLNHWFLGPVFSHGRAHCSTDQFDFSIYLFKNPKSRVIMTCPSKTTKKTRYNKHQLIDWFIIWKYLYFTEIIRQKKQHSENISYHVWNHFMHWYLFGQIQEFKSCIVFGQYCCRFENWKPQMVWRKKLKIR